MKNILLCSKCALIFNTTTIGQIKLNYFQLPDTQLMKVQDIRENLLKHIQIYFISMLTDQLGDLTMFRLHFPLRS